MVPREHVYHIEGCQFITEIHILKVRLKMSELLIFFPFLKFFYCFFIYSFIYLVIYLSLSFIIIITWIIIIVCFSVFITLCLDLVVEKNKQTNKKHQIPSASLTVLQFVEGLNMKKQI